MPPGTYHNYTQTGCVKEIPAGYYLNDKVKRTIEKCDNKCENECVLDFEKNNIICLSCNNADGFYKKEDGEIINGYYDCYTGNQETYYLDSTNNEYKKCYKTCRNCNELGIIGDHKCTNCFSNSTLNNSNCYEICKYFHYFDIDKDYYCTKNAQCPSEFPYKIIEKGSCVKNCSEDEKYKLTYKDTCYYKCPKNLYNFELDKCDIKCLTCNTESVKSDLCLTCNNNDNYYKKEADDSNKNNFINCYNTPFERYYLDLKDKSYNKCFEKCKTCDEKGIKTEHKCTSCDSGFTKNGTNCYEICPFYYYFDDENVYQCTEAAECPKGYFLIEPKKQCIDNCRNDDIYKFRYRKVCVDYMPWRMQP